jgi:hypothetical protein
MSRSGYSDDCGEGYAMWRGQVMSAIRGKRGQSFLKDLVSALEAMPEKKLIAHELIENGQVCALGAVGVARGIDMSKIDPYDYETLSEKFDIAHQLVREIEWENDERVNCSPEMRWQAMLAWAKEQIASS